MYMPCYSWIGASIHYHGVKLSLWCGPDPWGKQHLWWWQEWQHLQFWGKHWWMWGSSKAVGQAVVDQTTSCDNKGSSSGGSSGLGSCGVHRSVLSQPLLTCLWLTPMSKQCPGGLNSTAGPGPTSHASNFPGPLVGKVSTDHILSGMPKV